MGEFELNPEELEELQKRSERLATAWNMFESNNQDRFKKTLKRIKHILKKYEDGLIIPENWRQVYWEWYFKNKLDEEQRANFEKNDWDKLLSNEKVIIEWAKDYTKEVLNTETEPESKNSKTDKKRETLAVRYKLLDVFFKGNENFSKLKIKDQEILLGYVLGCDVSTAKHIKNNATKGNPDGKYITHKSINRAEELIEKIKKGIL